MLNHVPLDEAYQADVQYVRYTKRHPFYSDLQVSGFDLPSPS